MSLEGKWPQMTRQLELPFESRGEAPKTERSVEEPTAGHETERSGTSDLMERVCKRANLQAALKRVKKNKGRAGIDGMTVGELPEYLKTHWLGLREQLLAGTYQPSAVLRRSIPKSWARVRRSRCRRCSPCRCSSRRRFRTRRWSRRSRFRRCNGRSLGRRSTRCRRRSLHRVNGSRRLG
jgi:hypothetical protein